MSSSQIDVAQPKPKLRRLCKFPGCTNTVKSQGHCQRHGAKVKRCKVEGCEKEAKSGYNSMCKRHFKSSVTSSSPSDLPSSGQPPPSFSANRPSPEPEIKPISVYRGVLPKSLAWKPVTPSSQTDMPLVAHLKQSKYMEFAWHRNEERRARGLSPVAVSAHFESWERQLVMLEAMLLAGVANAPGCYRDLARAWGRNAGFHVELASAIFDRDGESNRKQRSDMGGRC